MAGRDEFVFVALGGVGEIGMNLGLYGFGPANDRQWIAVDCGITFAGPELPGIDLVYPDVSFLEKLGDRLLGMVITHAHEDHYGALAMLWPRFRAPVFASPFTIGLLEAKHEHDAASVTEMKPRVIRPGSRWSLGPFEIEAIAVAHSIPEPMALAIRTPLGTAVHTGDWKLDPAPQVGPPTDAARLQEIGEEGVLALVCDSTSAIREGRSPSEGDVAAEIAAVMKEAPGAIAFTLFSSNVARLRSIALAAREAGREVVVSGRAIRRVIDVATELGMLEGTPPFREAEELEHLPARHTALILSGSQGEPRAALARVASGEERRIRLGAGDTMVFSSRTIPGNDRAVIDIVNRLVARGVRVMTDQDRLVHASGHPRRDEMRDLYSWLRPQVLVPVHGEPLHLAAHRELGRAAGIATILDAPNGTVARLAPDPGVVSDAVPVGRRYRDGTIVDEIEQLGVALRRRMGFGGHIAVALTLDDRGEVAAGPAAVLTGVPVTAANGRPMAEIVEKAVHGALTGIPRPRRRDPELVADAVRRAVRAEIAAVWGKKPVCVVQVLTV